MNAPLTPAKYYKLHYDDPEHDYAIAFMTECKADDPHAFVDVLDYAALRQRVEAMEGALQIIKDHLYLEINAGHMPGRLTWLMEHAQAALGEVCPTCGGAKVIDSGGVTQWDAPIDIPCPSCTGGGGT